MSIPFIFINRIKQNKIDGRPRGKSKSYNKTNSTYGSETLLGRTLTVPKMRNTITKLTLTTQNEKHNNKINSDYPK